jgi:hypothetical protein
MVAYSKPALEAVVCSKPRAMKFGKIVTMAIPKNPIENKSLLLNLILRKKDVEIKSNIKPVKPYLTKLRVNGSILSITNLVKTNVDPPRVADKDAKKDPNSTFLITVLSLFIVNLL